MFRRKVYESLQRWATRRGQTALLVTGARQIGKSYLVERLGREKYQRLLTVNLYLDKAAKRSLAEASNVADLITRLSLMADQPLVPGETLIFIDEIQELPDLMTMVKGLVQDGRFSYAFSGSMLGTELKHVRSYPVGFVTEVTMFPMDFEEFCWSQGTDPTLWDAVKECFAAREPVPDFLHEMFLDLWLRYVLIGGMPEAVQVFADTHDTQLMRARQRGILDTYRADITRYVKDRVRARQIKTIFDAVPSQLNKESKRFIISGATDGKRFSRIASDFDWLADAGVVIPVHRATEATFPLGLSEERSYWLARRI